MLFISSHSFFVLFSVFVFFFMLSVLQTKWIWITTKINIFYFTLLSISSIFISSTYYILLLWNVCILAYLYIIYSPYILTYILPYDIRNSRNHSTNHTHSHCLLSFDFSHIHDSTLCRFRLFFVWFCSVISVNFVSTMVGRVNFVCFYSVWLILPNWKYEKCHKNHTNGHKCPVP